MTATGSSSLSARISRQSAVTAYFLRRLLLIIPTFIGITMVVFVIMHFVPGGPVERADHALQDGGDDRGRRWRRRTGMTHCPRTRSRRCALLRLRQAGAHPISPVAGQRRAAGSRQLLRLPGAGLGRHPIEISDLGLYLGLTGLPTQLPHLHSARCPKSCPPRESNFDFVTSAIGFLGYSVPGWALGTVLLVLFGGGSFWSVFPLGGFRPITGNT